MMTITKKQINSALTWQSKSGAVETTNLLTNQILDIDYKLSLSNYDELTTKKERVEMIYNNINK
jgi:hypothetical protein